MQTPAARLRRARGETTMDILPVSGGGPKLRAQPAAKPSGAGFCVPSETAPSAEARGMARTASVGAMAAMLGLQDVDPPQERDRRAKSRGEKMLDALRRLQISLLDGSDPAAISADLRQLSRDVPQAADPGLRGAIDAIGVRCAVELARREVAASRRFG
jgi:hypothetical protein